MIGHALWYKTKSGSMKGRKRALPLYRPFFVGVLSLFLVSRAIGAEPPVRFRLVSWNVENLSVVSG